jgi:hypothetical protein
MARPEGFEPPTSRFAVRSSSESQRTRRKTGANSLVNRVSSSLPFPAFSSQCGNIDGNKFRRGMSMLRTAVERLANSVNGIRAGWHGKLKKLLCAFRATVKFHIISHWQCFAIFNSTLPTPSSPLGSNTRHNGESVGTLSGKRTKSSRRQSYAYVHRLFPFMGIPRPPMLSFCQT